ncbi:hypothetical protein [Neptuniibacter caesariensis]|uniref:Uncharacterized protein n=1 Tax=Neptuniibacter caesariensis TaxID=207954 RepID=A0A7U8GR17_NEPCE|nr:hypothetical protein [Neptuniibacter caesariensis]EAR59737.1 hypothetical protein MED92_12431 [Oceanospirillum sp. MED92] [Neptuniibacter caesariensis]
MASKHLTEKLKSKLEKEDIKVKENNVRFTVTHLNHKGKVLGREWYKGFIAVSNKRLILASEGVKFLNIKKSDERFTAVRFEEGNVACLEARLAKEPETERSLVFHIYTSKVDKLLKNIEAL